MQYMRSYQFIMDKKNWMMNVLMGVVCSLIPVIGQIVFGGYLFEVIDSLHRDPEHRDYPDFDFNRFTVYLSRGIWPWLVNFILGLIIITPIVIIGIVVMFVLMAALKGSVVAVIVGELFLFGAIMLGALLEAILGWPAMLQAGLSEEFNFSNIVSFTKSFLKTVKKELILSILFIFGTGIVIGLVGYCALFVGALFAAIAVNMAAHHLMFQLYELYLERGGVPIPVKSSEPRIEPQPPSAEPV